MPKGVYDRKTKAKGPKHVGTHTPKRLRILPEDNASRPMQECTRLRARLTVAACAERSNRAEAELKSVWYNRKYSVCEGCSIGKSNAVAERFVQAEQNTPSSLVEVNEECDYCRGKGRYQIDGVTFNCECTAPEEVA